MADIQETKIWEWCKTHGDYAGYLMRYPNGIYSAEAKALMNEGNATQSASEKKPNTVKADPKFVMSYLIEHEKKELDEFNSCHTVSDYEDYVKKYPYGRYTSKAKELILKLRTITPSMPNSVIEQELDRIDAEFRKCKSIKDYENFIKKCPYEKYKEQARTRIEELKVEQEAQKNDNAELAKCKTIEEYQRFIETSTSPLNKSWAKNEINALKDEPINLTLSLVINVLSIAAIIVGLCINSMNFIGISLLACGILAIIVHSVAVKKWKNYWEYHARDNYLTSSAILLIIIGVIVCFRMMVFS